MPILFIPSSLSQFSQQPNTLTLVQTATCIIHYTYKLIFLKKEQQYLKKRSKAETWVAKSSRMPSLLIPCSRQSCFQNSIPIWFPHCPTCRVMISLGMFFRKLGLARRTERTTKEGGREESCNRESGSGAESFLNGKEKERERKGLRKWFWWKFWFSIWSKNESEAKSLSNWIHGSFRLVCSDRATLRLRVTNLRHCHFINLGLLELIGLLSQLSWADGADWAL